MVVRRRQGRRCRGRRCRGRGRGGHHDGLAGVVAGGGRRQVRPIARVGRHPPVRARRRGDVRIRRVVAVAGDGADGAEDRRPATRGVVRSVQEEGDAPRGCEPSRQRGPVGGLPTESNRARRQSDQCRGDPVHRDRLPGTVTGGLDRRVRRVTAVGRHPPVGAAERRAVRLRLVVAVAGDGADGAEDRRPATRGVVRSVQAEGDVSGGREPAGQRGGVGDLAPDRHRRRGLGHQGGKGLRHHHRLACVVARGADRGVDPVAEVRRHPPVGPRQGGDEGVGGVVAVAGDDHRGAEGRRHGAGRVVGTVDPEDDRAHRPDPAGQGGGVGDLAPDRHRRRGLGHQGGDGLRHDHRLACVVARGADRGVDPVTEVRRHPPVGPRQGGDEGVGGVVAVAGDDHRGAEGRRHGAGRVVGTVDPEDDRAHRPDPAGQRGRIGDLAPHRYRRGCACHQRREGQRDGRRLRDQRRREDQDEQQAGEPDGAHKVSPDRRRHGRPAMALPAGKRPSSRGSRRAQRVVQGLVRGRRGAAPQHRHQVPVGVPGQSTNGRVRCRP